MVLCQLTRGYALDAQTARDAASVELGKPVVSDTSWRLVAYSSTHNSLLHHTVYIQVAKNICSKNLSCMHDAHLVVST